MTKAGRVTCVWTFISCGHYTLLSVSFLGWLRQACVMMRGHGCESRTVKFFLAPVFHEVKEVDGYVTWNFCGIKDRRVLKAQSDRPWFVVYWNCGRQSKINVLLAPSTLSRILNQYHNPQKAEGHLSGCFVFAKLSPFKTTYRCHVLSINLRLLKNGIDARNST